MDTKKETRLADETTCLMEKYKLPDGRTLRFDRERFEAAEVLFTPPDSDVLGVADMLCVARAQPPLLPLLVPCLVVLAMCCMWC